MILGFEKTRCDNNYETCLENYFVLAARSFSYCRTSRLGSLQLSVFGKIVSAFCTAHSTAICY